MWSALLSAFMVGLLGSLHCVGMCGPLALAVGANDQGRNKVVALGLFTTGKGVTYGLLGVMAGIFGKAFTVAGAGHNGLAVLSLVAGGAMVLLGGQVIFRLFVKRVGHGPSALSQLMSALLRKMGPSTPLLVGLLTGLLPCGLVYAMMARAATAPSLPGAVLTMMAFGLGTAPSLWGVGGLSGLITTRVRRVGEWLAAVSIAVMGAATIFRGIRLLTVVGDGVSCCHH